MEDLPGALFGRDMPDLAAGRQPFWWWDGHGRPVLQAGLA